MKIVVLDGFTLNPGDLSWKGIEKLGNLTVYDRTEKEVDKIVKAIADAEIIFTNKTVLNKETIEKAPNVKYIGVLATGYNVVDIAAAKQFGITVTNVPGYSTNAVAQMTFALLLELTNQVGIHNSTVKAGEWSNSIDFCFWKTPLIELSDKIIGIIGFGQIGRTTAKIAQAFGMKVLVHSNRNFPELETRTLQFTNLDTLFEESDVISLHCPLTEKTEGIINKNSIEKMKDDVMIINTARGQLIVEEDLKNALNSNKVGAAAIDVVSVEPMPKDNPLFQAKNCIITPHIAWASKESRERLMNIAAYNLKVFLKGNPVNVVNG
ncbi:MAG: D-2-hydroxyacid dehydrogenase [Bacteroidota bacterium]